MPSPRTIFRENGLPIFEDHSSVEGLQWVTLKVCDSQEALFDAALMDLLIESLQLGNYILTDRPMHEEDRLWVSFPILYSTITGTASIEIIIRLILHYKEQILNGVISIDREYLFRPSFRLHVLY
ncbi:hypothetical protein PENNAL_c0033G10973 [Penicillium nalgiovense]|uniref:Uncharacterized protein n=1 Tax=Penicillium nalgiovense TaxID=60175 RepID=A0A1V6Y723_PENNA|nr:hypothetical protein PENNAL_c0033G10973 [Penicillium nalgiovense]